MSKTILIVDDSEDELRFYRRALKDFEGHVIKIALNGEEGLACALSVKPTLILLDYKLPDMDGLTFLRRLAETSDRDIPVIMLTGEGNESVAVEVMKLGAQDYIVKDTAGKFLRLLSSVINRVLASHTEKMEISKLRVLHQTILHTVADGVIGIDNTGIILFSNQSAEKLLSYLPNALVGSNIAKILCPNGKPAAWCDNPLANLTDFESNIQRDSDFISGSDGKLFPISYTAARLNITDVCSMGWVLVFQNISERKAIEQDLRIAATAFETHDAIVITDAQSKILKVNRAFSEITGYSAGEVLGKNPRMMQSGRQDRDFYIKMWQELLCSGSWSGEIWDKRKNGEIYPKWVTISVVKDIRQEPTHYVAVFSDITARKKIEEEVHNLAFYDALTKLPNRRLLLDRFQAALAASARRDDYGALLFIDLDRFKTLNDTLGHEYGDLLLIEVSIRIKSCVREMDTVARFGGDEFVVLMEVASNDPDDATRKTAQVAEKIRNALSEPYTLKGHEHHSSPSIGVNLFHGNDESIASLIEHADMAMYQAKHAGRNAVRFFDPVMQQNATTHDALGNDLHYAIELQQLHLHYQIQVDNDRNPLGAEAFLRWKHPERGMLMPGQFLPIAEESNLIVDIGHWVLQAACKQLALWRDDVTTRSLTLTVNISAKHFAQAEFVNEVAEVLRTCQVDPMRLKLELSEKLVMSEVSSAVNKIQALKNMGVRLSMDNFGTVYSSLSYLKQLSSDQLKIHKNFVQGITQDGDDAKLVQTIIDLAKSLDMGIFAEGVETEAQRDFLENHDCNTYQGYLFGKPVPIEEFDLLLRQG
jgi:diguanylate cyclase (GGDEF)-like protein/PAS domain S-box-containing protein